MLPFNQVTLSAVTTAFLSPYGEYKPLHERVWGGVALNDASQGREVQLWAISYDGVNVNVGTDGGAAQLSLPIPDVLTCSLGFDSNMNPAIAWTDVYGAHLRYFDSYTLSYVVLDIPGATSCKARTDDTRSFNSAASDVIFAYTLNGILRYRVQRDHYATEYTIGASGTGTLRRMGMNDGQRFQFEITELL
jgi:hypothetical protein